MKPIVAQTVLPIRYKKFEGEKPISGASVRSRIFSFLKDNLTKDLAERRDTFISRKHRLEFFSPFDFNAPSFKKSVRIESELDALLSQYAGIMQIPKRHVIWMAVALPDSQYPKVLPLREVLKQTGDVDLSFFDFRGRSGAR